MKPLDAKSTKPLEGGASFPLSNRLYRAVWNIAWALLASWTPPQMNGWRLLIISLFGGTVHRTAKIYGAAKIWYPPNLRVDKNAVIGPGAILYCMDKIFVEERAVISQNAHICCGSHDISSIDFQLVTAPINIKRQSWIGAEAFVGPGVIVGEAAVLGARAVLCKNAESNGVYVGNPAKKIKMRCFISSDIES